MPFGVEVCALNIESGSANGMQRPSIKQTDCGKETHGQVGNHQSTASSGVDASIAPRSSVRKCAADEKMREGFSPSSTLRVANKGVRRA